MGIYLNSSSAFGLFRRDCLSTYFIDKSSILKELVPLVTGTNVVVQEDGKNRFEFSKQSKICGDYQTAQVWKNRHGQYDCFLLWQRN